MTGRVVDLPQPQPPPQPGALMPLPSTSSAGRQGGLVLSFEGARGLAAMLVALFHFGLAEPPIVRIRAGYLFVDLFFVLSGFLICTAYAGKLDRPAALPNFLVRRIGRLLPLMLVATLAYLLMLNLGVLVHRRLDGAALPYIRPPLTEWLATLTMTHSLGWLDRVTMNYATWSISTEFYAYIAFAILCLLLRGPMRLPGFALVSGAAYLVSIWASVRMHGCLAWGGCMDLTFDYGYWRCLAGFFLGATLSHVRPRRPIGARLARPPWLAPALGQAASLSALLAMFVLSRRVPAAALAAPLLFGFLLLSIRADTGPLARLLGTAPLQMLGRYSYSIYLMHPVVLLAWNPGRGYALGSVGRLAFLAGYVAIVLAVSRVTFRWIEDPMRRRFNRFAARRFGTRGAAEVSAAQAQ